MINVNTIKLSHIVPKKILRVYMREYKCEHSATTAINLRTHSERFLEGVRYPCDKCDFDLTRAYGL